jgi:hypothetical protein
MTWPDGGYYEGEFYQGQMHGKGKLVRADGTIGFQGQYRNGQPVVNTSSSNTTTSLRSVSSQSSMGSTSSYQTTKSASTDGPGVNIVLSSRHNHNSNSINRNSSRRRPPPPPPQPSSRPSSRGSRVDYHPTKSSKTRTTASSSRKTLPSHTATSQDQDWWDKISHCTEEDDDDEKYERGSLAAI